MSKSIVKQQSGQPAVQQAAAACCKPASHRQLLPASESVASSTPMLTLPGQHDSESQTTGKTPSLSLQGLGPLVAVTKLVTYPLWACRHCWQAAIVTLDFSLLLSVSCG
jgi:hypothetical protein